MTPDKQTDIRCMCLSFAVSVCRHMPPDRVVETADLFERFILGSRSKLRVVSNDETNNNGAV